MCQAVSRAKPSRASEAPVALTRLRHPFRVLALVWQDVGSTSAIGENFGTVAEEIFDFNPEMNWMWNSGAVLVTLGSQDRQGDGRNGLELVLEQFG